jgi:hypothetical protein
MNISLGFPWSIFLYPHLHEPNSDALISTGFFPPSQFFFVIDGNAKNE